MNKDRIAELEMLWSWALSFTLQTRKSHVGNGVKVSWSMHRVTINCQFAISSMFKAIATWNPNPGQDKNWFNWDVQCPWDGRVETSDTGVASVVREAWHWAMMSVPPVTV